MFLRLIRPEKSSTVKEPTIIELILALSCTFALSIAIAVFAAGDQILTTTRTSTAAKHPVTTKVNIRLPKILPKRFMFSILPTAVAIETNTIGTTIVNIKLIKIFPKGSNTVAFSPKTTPNIAPAIIPPSKMSGDR
ncbi:hypothetical protein H04402_01986 [Clostridium botulinum H04402 065]|nr:hypothetical protein H04402_01986 [Clostridium botulinum H04402 065]